jgi:hypothetical protein
MKLRVCSRPTEGAGIERRLSRARVTSGPTAYDTGASQPALSTSGFRLHSHALGISRVTIAGPEKSSTFTSPVDQLGVWPDSDRRARLFERNKSSPRLKSDCRLG